GLGSCGAANGCRHCRSGFSRDRGVGEHPVIRSRLKPLLQKRDQAPVFFAAVFFAVFFAAFLVAFFAVFFAAFFVAFLAGAFFAAAFFAGTFLAAFLPKRPRAGLPVSSNSLVTSSRVSEAGSRSFGILPLSWPLLM